MKHMNRYKLIDTASGLKSLIYRDAREIRLHSAYDPLKEAERAVNAFNPGRCNYIIVLGLGLGYHVKFLKEKYPARTIIAAERDDEVIKITKEINPAYVKNIKIIKSSNELIKVFEQTDIAKITGISAFIHRQSYALDKPFYDLLVSGAREFISSRFSDLLTRFEFEADWVDHIFRNIHQLYKSIPVSEFFGKFSGIPGIIVSAGPSLRKNIHILKQLKDKALIVCVDTALKILLRNNIQPHLVMTIDSQKYSLKHFIGIQKPETVLLADIVSHPRVIDSFSGSRAISTTTKYFTDENGKSRRETTPAWDWVEQFTGPIGDIQSGGSVATSVFDLLLNLKCDPIILVGQDLAYSGREIHCAGTYHNDDWLSLTGRFKNLETINQSIIRKRKIKYIKGYYGDRVLTDFVFDIYRYWFNDSAGKVSVDVINATEGGARIENTIEKPLNRVAAEIKSLRKTPASILNEIVNLHKKPETNKTLKNGIEKAIDDLKAIIKKSGEFPDKPVFEKEILEFISGSSVSPLVMPFLRKTFIYLTRHPDLESGRARNLLSGDIKINSEKLIVMLESCKQNLEKIR